MNQEKIIDKLKEKANNVKGSRFPNLREIEFVLKSNGIKCYVAGQTLYLDNYRPFLQTYSTYYSCNTWNYAQKILEMLKIEWEENKY